VNPLGAPLRCPFHFGNFGKRARANCAAVFPGTRGSGAVQIDEPLFGGAEDHRIVATPAMRVTVLEFPLSNQRPTGFEQSDNQRIRFKNGFAFVLR
jgi:hypothetical protein